LKLLSVKEQCNNNRNSVWSSGSNKSNWNSEFKDLINK